METLLFYTFAVLALFSGLMVVLRRNAVASALFLVITFFCLAGIYVLMDAFFLAAIQVAVYAGAIMVLFLFAIMLLKLGDKQAPTFLRGKVRWIYAAGSVALALVFLGCDLLRGIQTSPDTALMGEAGLIAESLFSDFLLPFEITALLLLVAIVGAVVMVGRHGGEEA